MVLLNLAFVLLAGLLHHRQLKLTHCNFPAYFLFPTKLHNFPNLQPSFLFPTFFSYIFFLLNHLSHSVLQFIEVVLKVADLIGELVDDIFFAFVEFWELGQLLDIFWDLGFVESSGFVEGWELGLFLTEDLFLTAQDLLVIVDQTFLLLLQL